MFWKRTALLTLSLLIICSYGIALTPEATDICLERGKSSRIFADDTTADDLIVETYTIHAFDESYEVCVVTPKKQRSDVEFGWLSIQLPSNIILQSSRTRRSYEDAVRMLTWEQLYGCNYFWSAARKAQYYYELRGTDARITCPNENEITEEQAVEIACQTLMEDLALTEKQIAPLLISVEFYQDDTPNDSVQSKRFWGVTFREKDDAFRFPALYAVVIDGLSGCPEHSIDYQKDLIIEHIK